MFFAIDGIDGCGKSSQAKFLASALSPPSKVFRHPGETNVGMKLRQILLHDQKEDPLSVETQMLLFEADMTETSHLIAKLRKEGVACVADRWYSSTYAYQGADWDRQISWSNLNPYLLNADARIPDLLIILDEDIEVAAARLDAKKKDFFESKGKDYFIKVRNLYREFYHTCTLGKVAWLQCNGDNMQRVHERIVDFINCNTPHRLKPIKVDDA